MVRGREFTEAEEMSATAPRVAIVDERFARKLFGADDPIGQMIRYSARPGETTKNGGSRWRSSASPRRSATTCSIARPGPRVYEPWGRNYRGNMFLHVRAARAGPSADLLAGDPPRDAGLRSDAAGPRRRRRCTRSTIGASSCGPSSAGGRLFLIFGCSRLLAVVGLYGVKSVHRVAADARDRDPHGARRAAGDVLSMMLKEGAALAAVGVAVGLPLAALLGFAMSSLLYDVKPLDPVVVRHRAGCCRASPRWSRPGSRPPRHPRHPLTALRATRQSLRLPRCRVTVAWVDTG